MHYNQWQKQKKWRVNEGRKLKKWRVFWVALWQYWRPWLWAEPPTSAGQRRQNSETTALLRVGHGMPALGNRSQLSRTQNRFISQQGLQFHAWYEWPHGLSTLWGILPSLWREVRIPLRARVRCDIPSGCKPIARFLTNYCSRWSVTFLRQSLLIRHMAVRAAFCSKFWLVN